MISLFTSSQIVRLLFALPALHTRLVEVSPAMPLFSQVTVASVGEERLIYCVVMTTAVVIDSKCEYDSFLD